MNSILEEGVEVGRIGSFKLLRKASAKVEYAPYLRNNAVSENAIYAKYKLCNLSSTNVHSSIEKNILSSLSALMLVLIVDAIFDTT